MQAAIQLEFVHALPAHAAIRASGVGDLILEDGIAHAVGNARRDHFDFRIAFGAVGDARPADAVDPGVFHRLEKLRNILRIILKIGVHRHHIGAAGIAQSGVGCRRLSAVVGKLDPPHARVLRDELLDLRPGVVLRSIIDQQQLEVDIQWIAHIGNRRVQ